MGELSEVVRQQKLRMRGLAQERAEAQARLQAMNPQVGGGGGFIFCGAERWQMGLVVAHAAVLLMLCCAVLLMCMPACCVSVCYSAAADATR